MILIDKCERCATTHLPPPAPPALVRADPLRHARFRTGDSSVPAALIAKAAPLKRASEEDQSKGEKDRIEQCSTKERSKSRHCIVSVFTRSFSPHTLLPQDAGSTANIASQGRGKHGHVCVDNATRHFAKPTLASSFAVRILRRFHSYRIEGRFVKTHWYAGVSEQARCGVCFL